MRIFCFFLGIILSAFLWSCANSVPLTGGVKDAEPPRIIQEETTPSPTVNFDGRQIRLTFNEWVKLNNANKQVIISPLLAYKPTIEIKRKSVMLTLDEREVLKPNTTYIIQWGNAIGDLTENNKVPNLVNVLATGNEVDSLTFGGKVVDQVTGKAEGNTLVMLYENQADSVVRTEKPYYFAETDKDGIFKLEYLKAGTYKIFALKDANANYLFDQPQEKIAFIDSLITVPDTSNTSLLLKAFEEDPPILLQDKKTRSYGVLKFLYNQNPEHIQTNIDTLFKNPAFKAVSKDTLLIWYSDTTQVEKEIILYNDEKEYRDTIGFKIPKKKKQDAKRVQMAATKITISTQDTANVFFTQPLQSVVMDSVRIREDSVEYAGTKLMEIQRADPQILDIKLEFKEKSTYYVMFLPNALVNIWGDTNTDTLRQQMSILSLDEFGDLNVTVAFPDSTQQYLVELQNAKNKTIQRHIVTDVSSFNIQQKTLPAGVYQIQVIEDMNANGKKDSGSYDEKRQPERIFLKKLDELRPKWELEATVPVEF